MGSDPTRETPLPTAEERQRILTRAAFVLTEARALADQLDRTLPRQVVLVRFPYATTLAPRGQFYQAAEAVTTGAGHTTA